MSEDSEDDPADASEDAPDEESQAESPDEEALVTRLEDAEAALEDAETEDDLDDVSETLADIEADLEAADLPVPDDEDEDEEAPADRIEDRLSDLEDELESQRGPYLEDVTDVLEDAEATLSEAEWTSDGREEAVAAVDDFFDAVNDIADQLDLGGAEAVEAHFELDAEEPDEAAEALGDLRGTIAEQDLHPDHDADLIGTLLDAAETLEDDLEAAEIWDDLTVREQLGEQGFYDVLDPENRKDYPAEWNAVKIYEKAGDVEPILTALEKFESDFMEENILDALEHIAPEEAFDPIHERAQKRNKQCVRILGRIGDERACDTLEDFLGGGDVKLEVITLRALGAIGSADSTQAVANRLAADNPEIRSAAARSLGLIGDTRAIDPLADVLADDDENEVRASAAWALNQIGTGRALEEAAAYADDRSYIVQAEAEKAAGV